jgi:hypothetical protein
MLKFSVIFAYKSERAAFITPHTTPRQPTPAALFQNPAKAGQKNRRWKMDATNCCSFAAF